MSRRIVFINQATGYLTIDVINEFAGDYNEIALITGSIRVQDIPLHEKVKVDFIVKYNRGNTIKKSISWVIGTLQIYFLLITKYRRYEKFYFTIPPASYLLALHFRSPFVLLVYDLYPEALKSFGIEKRNLIYRWWAKRNRRVFPRATRIFTLSDKMKSQILEYSDRDNVTVIPNWTAFAGLPRIGKGENRLISTFNLQDKFIVQYSGNIGQTHKVETLVEIAEMLSSSDKILFLIIGRGERLKTITSLIDEKNLKNCMVLPFRKDEDLFDALCAADLAVVTLDDKTPDVSVPSKTYNILAAGIPIMSIAAEQSEISRMVEAHQIGKNFDKNDIEGMCRFIVELNDNPDYRDSLAARSIIASQSFTRSNAKKYRDIYLEQ
ncbi:MAG TPA: glycosyltransferase WbuB [Bacteroidales bacterium]|nr:glycosyltransferase WbuB [Bacteroidales bacterium]